MDAIQLTGTLRFEEFEGGFWVLELDSEDPRFGAHVVLPGWTPPAPLAAGDRVRARVHVREEQIGFLMAGTMVDVLDVEPLATS